MKRLPFTKIISFILVIYFTGMIQASEGKLTFEGAENKLMKSELPRGNYLQNLTQAQMATLPERQRMAVYACLMSGGDEVDWVREVARYMNQDEKSGSMLVELLRYPVHQGIRAGIWYWLGAHPDYPQAAYVLKASIDLFHSEGADWGYSERSSLAGFLASSGTIEQASIFDELQVGMGETVGISRIRFNRRLNLPDPEKNSSASSGFKKSHEPTTTAPGQTESSGPKSFTTIAVWTLVFLAAGFLVVLVRKQGR